MSAPASGELDSHGFLICDGCQRMAQPEMMEGFCTEAQRASVDCELRMYNLRVYGQGETSGEDPGASVV